MASAFLWSGHKKNYFPHNLAYTLVSLSIAGLPPPALSSPQGQKLTFFGRCQLVTEIFFQSPNCSKTQDKIFGRHRLACKIFAIDVIRNQTSAEVIFSTL